MAWPKNRNEAMLRGKKHYWTGKPCKRGHIAGRYINNGVCMECRRLDQYARWLRQKGETTNEPQRVG